MLLAHIRGRLGIPRTCGGRVMRIRRSAGVCAAALAASMSASYAGPCSNDIGSMQAKINHKLAAIVAAGPPAPPSAMVGVAQPTPRSLGAVAERMGEISQQSAGYSSA